jgi:hypothetical protein
VDLGDIPPIGNVTATISGELDVGFIAEPLSPDGYEQDDFPDDGTSLLPGEVQSHIVHPDGDVDWIKVSAVQDQEYEVKTFGLAGSVPDTVLEVYDEAGVMVTWNDNYAWDPYYFDWWSLASLVSWTAEYTGTYYVKARTYGGSYDHFDDQGGGPAFCSYEISFPCADMDGDGYGDPGSTVCIYPEPDCDDSSPGVNPGAKEDCTNGIDDDCDGDTDGADSDCGYLGIANAEASVHGRAAVTGSGVFNELTLLLVPACAIVLLRTLRRKK